MDGMNVPFSITRITEGTTLDDQGNVQDVYTVYWTIPGLGSYTTNIPKSEFSDQEAHDLIQQKADALGGLLAINQATHGAQG